MRGHYADDLVASGGTQIEAARALRAAGAVRIDALAVHCLASHDDLAAMEAAGLATIRATDTVASACGDLPIAGLLADALREHDWADETGG